MVAIVSGMRAGLDLSSSDVLGFKDLVGGALQGRKGQGVNVNIATGQVVLQDQDDLLVARGQDAAVLRTYNSNGSLNDENGDGWTSGIGMLLLSGTLNTVGSTIQRVEPDGAAAVYTWDTSRALYVTAEGAGAYDTIGYIASDAQYEWRDGSTGATQRYEGSGASRLVSSKDASGNAVTYAYGANGLLSAVTTASGETQLYDYTGNNLAQVRTVAAGVTTTRVRYAYDASNRLTGVTVDLTPADNSVVDGKVYQTIYAYDGTSKRIASIAQSDGSSVAFSYIDVGGGNFKVATVRDALNQTTSFTYGAGFTTVTDPLGLVTRYDFDASAQIKTISGPAVGGASAVRQFTYSASGDVLSVTDGEMRTVTYQYDADGNQVLQRDAAGDTITRTFDARNQLLNESAYTQPDPDGAGPGLPAGAATTRQVYDAAGRNQLRFSITATGRVSEYRYDGFGQRVASITYSGTYPLTGLAPEAALPESALAAWAAGQDLTSTQRVDIAYDARGQVQTRTTYARVASDGTGVVDGSQSVERFVYDTAGLLLQTVSATNGTTSFTYDGLGRTLTATNALGQVTVTQYDDAGRRTVVTQANGLVTTSAYDAAGRRTSVLQSTPAGGTLGETRYFYDADNRLRMTQDPTGVRSWFLYDEAGRRTAEIDGNGSMKESFYDRSGAVTSMVTWGVTVNTALLVDASGLPIMAATSAIVRPAASSDDYAAWRQYDAAGRLVREATSTGTGATALVTEWRYDGASRLTQVVRYATPISTATAATVAPGAVSLPSATVQDRITRNFYDDDGRLVGTLDAEGFLKVFRYTGAGQLSESVAYATPTDATLRATGTLAQLTPAAAAQDIRELTLYDGKGQAIASVDGEGYLTESVRDGNGNITQSVRYATRVTGTPAANSTIAMLRPAPTPQDRATLRSFDTLNRIVQETSPEGVVTQYGYDNAGNLVSTVRAVGTGEVRTLLARYDAQGRLVGELSARGATLLTGGQTQAQVDAIWQQYGTTYAYDAASRRIASTDPLGNRTLFFYNVDGDLAFSVNALGELKEMRYDGRGRVTDTIAYAKRIATAGLTGGLVTSAITGAVAAIADATVDSRTSVTYTRDSHVATATDAEGAVTSSSFNAFGDEISRQLTGTGVSLLETYAVDRLGHRTGTVRDAAGLNAVSSAVYDAFGRLVRSVDANGNVREQAFDRLGRVITIRDPLNATRSTSYDAFARVLTQTDALGNATTYAYDATARSMTVTTPEGIATTTTYTRHGQVQSISDGRGQVTSYRYDADGNLLQTTMPLATTSGNYDAAGHVLDTTDANGNKVAYSYDAAGRVLTRRVDPSGLNLLTSYAYDGKGQRVSVTDANLVVTTTTFDRNGRTAKVTVDPAGLNLQTVYSYDARGNVLTVRTPGGTLTQYVYDALGRRTQERVDPAGLNLQRSWTYDRNGNVLASTDASGNVTRYAYDANDRLVFTVDAAGDLRQNGYDAEGRVVKTVAYATPVATSSVPATPTVAQLQALAIAQPVQDVVEHRVYDKDGRLAATVDGTGAVVRYTYDANGNVVARTAAATRIAMAAWVPGTLPTPAADSGHDVVVRTVYDGLNRAIYSMDGVGAVVALVYDGNGNVVQRTAYAVPIPTNTNFTSSAIAAAVASVANPARDAVVRNTYDSAGRLAWTVDGTGAVTQKIYDANGNVVRQVAYATPIAQGAAASSVPSAAGDRATSMAYDTANRLVVQVDALRGVTEQVLNGDGQVVRRTVYAKTIASVPALGASGTVNAIRSLLVPDSTNDRSTLFGYDAAGRQVIAVDALGAVIQADYDGVGNVVTQTARARTIVTTALPAAPSTDALKALVTGDAADRVTRTAYDGAGRAVFTVDAVGAVKGMQYDGAGRLTRSTRYAALLRSTSTYTAAGVASALQPDATRDQVDAFAYNAAGQLIASTDAAGSTESYTYDALGNKLSFTNKKNFTWTYAYDAAGHLLSETTPVVQLTSATVGANGTIALSSDASARVLTRLAYDALGNVVQRTEAAGRSEERTTRYEYDAIGRQVRVVFPMVGVYDPSSDPLIANGASGVASRVETQKSLETRTFYDTLGNAVANRDVGDAQSQKVYDVLGRVLYEIDALGYVTGYTRNAFGDVTSLTRYAVATTLASASVTQASQASTRTMVDAAIGAAGVDHSKDRTLLSAYDRAGRLLAKTEPTVFMYDSVSGQSGNFGAQTRYVYDAFGQQVQEQKLRFGSTWATTTHYYDKVGHDTATVDAMGYLTERMYDQLGNLTSSSEYINPVASGWSLTSYARGPLSQDEDRVTTYSYDVLNRKRTETRLRVETSTSSDGTSARPDLTTTYEYDALGNQTRVVDAGQNATVSYYDALGRVSAIAAPQRSSTASGATLTPLTTFLRDAFGNVVAKTDYAGSATGVTASSFTAPGASADDRTTYAMYDKLGHGTQSTDALGNQQFVSYDAYGHLAKRWQAVSANDGTTRTVYEQDAYDKLGRVTASLTPAPGSTSFNVAPASSTLTSVAYNAFGEITGKGTEQGVQEYFEYDNAGRLWRTNTGDGVDHINLYDALGNVTSDIRSTGAGLTDLDVKTFANAEAAAANPNTRRADTEYDALGHVTRKLQAYRQEAQGGAVVQRQYTTQTVQTNAADWLGTGGLVTFGARNKVALTWNNLSQLGGGDIKVTIEYRTSVIAIGGLDDTGKPRTTPGSAIRTFTSGLLDGGTAASGTTLEWFESNTTNEVGISAVTRIVVQKRDRAGNWLTAIDQAPGVGANEVLLTAPPDANTAMKLEMRVAGSAGDTGWWQAGLSAFGNLSRFDAAGLLAGKYEYRVTVAPGDGSASRVTATGTVAITQPPLNVISAQITFGRWSAPAGALTWTTPGASYQQAFRYRPNGSTGGWSTLNVGAPMKGYEGVYDGVDLSGLGAGTYQFELLWSLATNGAPTSHATGTFTVVAPVPSVWVPPVNLPNITGLKIGTGLYGATFVNISESHVPNYWGGTQVPALIWTAAGATTAQYRVAGGAWTNLAINSDAQYSDESGVHGTQQVLLNGIPPGTYEVQILAGSPPTAQATANVTVNAQIPGYYVTVNVQVATYVPVVAYYAPVYETRYGTRTASRTVWVNDPPYVTGYDEAGNPIWAYPGHWATQYYTETYAYQVQVGQTPVYARDENGNIIYQTVWVTHQQQQWVPPTTPAPTIAVTTPGYTAGYWTTAQSAQYGLSLTTAAGSASISTGMGSAMSQSAGVNGDARWQRPVITQKTDRWGNVLEISDPRSASWKTTYRYNASNQLVQQTLPDGALTSLYYDALGRQVAVRDANGNVNGKVYDASGNVVKELHADGGVVSNAYNAFGEKVSTTDAMGNVVGFTYDKLGHLLRTTRAQAGVWGVNGANQLVAQGIRNIVDSWTYDQLGRKLTQTNGNGEQIKYTYDLAGNVVETWQPMGQVVRAAYDARGRKIAELDANGRSSTWAYNYFGQLTAHTDLGGASFTYTYDNARQLTRQSNSRGQSIDYAYDAGGQVTSIHDWADDKITTYVYDLSGRRIRERVVQGGVTYQDNNMAYDARGNLRDVADARVHVSMAYDAVGNRTFIGTSVDYLGTAGEAVAASNRFYKYDAMNRQVAVDAVDPAGNRGTQGHTLTYDRNGNRTSDTYFGPKVVPVGGVSVILGYNEDGSAVYTTTPPDFTSATGDTTETYTYDHLNRLMTVQKDGMQIDVRYYDGADRVVQSGPAGVFPTKYADIANQGLTPDQMNGKETRINRYDANGRLMHQKILKSDNSPKVDISWDPNENSSGYTADGYDAAGNARGYVVDNHEAGVLNEFTTATMQYFEGYQAATTHGVSSKQQPGDSTQLYDANGWLVGVQDSTQGNNNRTFVNDANGKALYVNQAGNIQRQLVVNGEVLGQYGVGVNPTNPASGYNNNPNFANMVDFEFGYARVSANYPSASPGAYTVHAGDTLQSIAQTAYGDSSLWYRIADANGLASSNDLKIGQTLNIPNRLSTTNNNANTFKPYDPSRIEGDKTPSLAMPKPKKGSWLAQLVMLVVAVAVAYFTGQLYVANFGTATASSGAELAVTVSGEAAATSVAEGVASWTSTSLAASQVAGAAAGSLASQAVGVATGVQDRLSWKSVALSSISAGISGGISGYSGFAGMTFSSNAVLNRAVQSAVANALTQVVGVATGLQDRFDWRGVAASFAGAGVSKAVESPGSNPTFGSRVATGLLAGAVAAAARGGRVAIQQVAVDAFGNAVGQSMGEAITQKDPLGDFIDKKLEQQQGRDSYGLTGSVDPVGLRFSGELGLTPTASTMAVWAREADEGISVGAREIEEDWSIVPTRGARTPPRQSVGYRAGSLLELFKRAPDQEISRNEGREALMNGVDDLTGFVGLVGDYRVIGNALQLNAQADKNKAELEAIRKDLLALGKKPPMGDVDMYAPGDGARVLADKLTEHRNFVRLTAYEQAGVITLNDDFSIRTVGKNRLTPVEFVNQLRGVYQAAVTQGSDLADARLRDGRLFVNTLKFGPAAEDIAKGNFVDSFGKGAVRTWLEVQGVPEGPFGMVSINRRFTDAGNIISYRMPDVLVNYGPRAILALDATLGTKTVTTPQVRDSLRYGVTDWVNVTPGGSQWIKNPSLTPAYRWRLR